MIKRSIFQENITNPKVYVPNNRVSKYVRQKLTALQGKQKNPLLQLETLIPLSGKERSSRQKIGKDIVELNSFINQVSIIDIYRLFHSTIADYILPRLLLQHSPDRLYLGHKTHLNKLKKQKSYDVCSQTQWN